MRSSYDPPSPKLMIRACRAWILVAILLTLLGGAPRGASDSGWAWINQVVESGVSVYGSTSIALDDAGRPHVAFVDAPSGRVRYGSWTGDAWDVTSIPFAGRASGMVSMVLDAFNRPHLVFPDSASGLVFYAHLAESTWRVGPVDNVHAEGFVTIALARNGTVHLAYAWSNGDLRYASLDGLTWILETADAAPVTTRYPSLAFDSQNRPHIAYYGNGHLWHAVWIGYRWLVDMADEVSPQFVNIAIGPDDMPQLAYRGSESLMYARWNGTAWLKETVDHTGDVGWDARLALDPQGRPHIVHYNRDLARAEYVWQEASNWSAQVVDVEYVSGWYLGLAIDSQGQPHVVYFSYSQKAVKYASGTNALGVRTWPVDNVDPTTAVVVAEVTSLGNDSHVMIGIEWRPAGGDWHRVDAQALVAPGRVSVSLGDLEPNATFEARAVATSNGTGPVYGNTVSFRTPPVPRTVALDPRIVLGILSAVGVVMGLLAYRRWRRRDASRVTGPPSHADPGLRQSK